MKLVFDTNVLIAALIARGVCAELLEHCIFSHRIVISEFILTELKTQLVNKFKFMDQEAHEAVTLFASQMEIVAPARLLEPVCRDPDDDQILGTAVAGRVDCIITGDKDLLVLQQYGGVPIIRPAQFASFEEQH